MTQGRGVSLFTGLFTGLVIWSCLLGWPITGWAEPVVTVHGDGVIDWSARVVRVVGVGTPRVLSPTGALTGADLEASARSDAAARMARALAEVPFDSGRSLGGVAAFDGAREAAARGVRVGAARHFSDGTVHVPAEVDLASVVDPARRAEPSAAPAAPVDPGAATGWVVVLADDIAPTLRVALRGAGVAREVLGASWVRDRADVPAGFLGDRPRTIQGRAAGVGVIEVGEDAADLLAGGTMPGGLVIVSPDPKQAKTPATKRPQPATKQPQPATNQPPPAQKPATPPAEKGGP